MHARRGTAQAEPLDPLTLRFRDREREREFCLLQDEAALRQVRAAGVLAIVLYGAFGVLDTFVAEGDVTGLLVIRFAIVIPLILVALWASTTAWGPRHLQPIVVSVVVVASFGLYAMPLVADVPEDYARTGSLLILMFLFAFARVRFAWAAPTTVVLVLGYEGSLLLDDATGSAVLYNSFFLLGFVVVGASASYSLDRLRRLEHLRSLELAEERARSDRLLDNVLPPEIAARLRTEPGTIAEGADEVSVLFADIAGFTPLSETLPPAQVVELLDRLFCRFDALCAERGIEKVKTIGDAYMAVTGVPSPDPDHAPAAVELAIAMQDVADAMSPSWPVPLRLRIGISSGPVVAGVIGRRKFAYDLWGDTVNTASRMESHGRAGAIQVSETTYRRIQDRFPCTELQSVLVKGKGAMRTAFVLRGAPAPATAAVPSRGAHAVA